MKHMYELRDQYKGLMQISDELPPEALADTLDALKDDIETKGMQITHAIKMMDTTAIDAEIKRLQAMKNGITKQKEWLTGYLRDNMEACDINKIEWDTGSVTLRKPPAICSIDDESKIPDEFKTTQVITNIDKAAIKRALKDRNVPGASLQDGKRGLIIK